MASSTDPSVDAKEIAAEFWRRIEARAWTPWTTRSSTRGFSSLSRTKCEATRQRTQREQESDHGRSCFWQRQPGHRLYGFAGDTKAQQTTGEGLTDSGAAWDAVAPNGRSIEPQAAGSSGKGDGSGW